MSNSQTPRPDRRQIRTVLLPELIYTMAGPYLVYRLAIPHLSVVAALALAAALPVVRTVERWWRKRQLSLLGLLALSTVGVKLALALVLKDTRSVLAADAVVPGLYGAAMLGSLVLGRPLVWELIPAIPPARPAPDREEAEHWQQGRARTFFGAITAVFGAGLCLESALDFGLAYRLSPDQFLLIGPALRWGTLCLLGAFTFFFARWRRRRVAP